VTPFETWYAANIASQLPADYPPQLAEAGKKSAAMIWNAALDAAIEAAVGVGRRKPASVFGTGMRSEIRDDIAELKVAHNS
jgi:hypothetical protein